MPLADRKTYLAELVALLKKQWPDNRTVNIVCHGHSVPAGYFATPYVDTFNSYPHLLHRKLKERFLFAVINVIITAIGGENSIQGSQRFSKDVLCHRPDLILIDYGLNDRKYDEDSVYKAWKSMVSQAKENGAYIMLLTPTWDFTVIDAPQDKTNLLYQRAEIIRQIATEEETALVDSYLAFERAVKSGIPFETLMSWSNHPSRKGHNLVVSEIFSWFPF